MQNNNNHDNYRYLICMLGLFLFLVGCTTNSPDTTLPPEVLNYITDTTAVRSILDSNDLFTTTAASVSDSSQGRIVRLRLQNKKLTQLPVTIQRLSALSILNIEQNAIVTLPSEIQNCKQLTYLNCSKNQLNCLPTELGYITTLKTFRMDNNQVLDIPGSLSYCKDLDTLVISHNLLANLPGEIKALTGLSCLDIGYNKLKNLPDSLKTWANTYNPGWDTTQSRQ